MKNCPFFYVEEYVFSGDYVKLYYGHITDAKTPKEAVRKYLLYYWHDTETINYVRKAARKMGCNFIVKNTAKNKTSYFITM